MIEGLLQPVHLIFVLAFALLILGPRKLPELGQGQGKGIIKHSPRKIEAVHLVRAERDEGRQELASTLVPLPFADSRSADFLLKNCFTRDEMEGSSFKCSVIPNWECRTARTGSFQSGWRPLPFANATGSCASAPPPRFSISSACSKTARDIAASWKAFSGSLARQCFLELTTNLTAS